MLPDGSEDIETQPLFNGLDDEVVPTLLHPLAIITHKKSEGQEPEKVILGADDTGKPMVARFGVYRVTHEEWVPEVPIREDIQTPLDLRFMDGEQCEVLAVGNGHPRVAIRRDRDPNAGIDEPPVVVDAVALLNALANAVVVMTPKQEAFNDDVIHQLGDLALSVVPVQDPTTHALRSQMWVFGQNRTNRLEMSTAFYFAFCRNLLSGLSQAYGQELVRQGPSLDSVADTKKLRWRDRFLANTSKRVDDKLNGLAGLPTPPLFSVDFANLQQAVHGDSRMLSAELQRGHDYLLAIALRIVEIEKTRAPRTEVVTIRSDEPGSATVPADERDPNKVFVEKIGLLENDETVVNESDTGEVLVTKTSSGKSILRFLRVDALPTLKLENDVQQVVKMGDAYVCIEKMGYRLYSPVGREIRRFTKWSSLMVPKVIEKEMGIGWRVDIRDMIIFPYTSGVTLMDTVFRTGSFIDKGEYWDGKVYLVTFDPNGGKLKAIVKPITDEPYDMYFDDLPHGRMAVMANDAQLLSRDVKDWRLAGKNAILSVLALDDRLYPKSYVAGEPDTTYTVDAIRKSEQAGFIFGGLRGQGDQTHPYVTFLNPGLEKEKTIGFPGSDSAQKVGIATSKQWCAVSVLPKTATVAEAVYYLIDRDALNRAYDITDESVAIDVLIQRGIAHVVRLKDYPNMIADINRMNPTTHNILPDGHGGFVCAIGRGLIRLTPPRS